MADDEARLSEIYQGLPDAQRKSLLDFAEFLDTRTESRPAAPPQVPETIPRPKEESVLKAIQRLSATYPMLDKSTLMSETTTLMGQHVMEGRDVTEVIDDLESLFRGAYEKLREDKG